MNPVSPLPAIVALLVALATSFLLVKKYGAPPDQGRYSSIDGLRGYLAFFVFLSHASIWYFYLRTGQWKIPPSNLYTHFGQSGVALFFMITGLLFFSKLIDGRTKSIDWGKLFVSRFLRLVPLYLFVMLLLFLVVAYLSNGTLNEPISKVIEEVIRWLGFTILGAVNINGIDNTFIIVAGVTWSLPYEWYFYLSLPVLALTVGVRPPVPYIALGAISVIVLTMRNLQIEHIMSFLGGITAAFLVRSELFRRFAVRRFSSCIALSCVITTVFAFPTMNGPIPLLLLSVAFAIIASGNSLFGVLVSPVSRFLGEFAYSIYLLHGITLFIVFTLIVGLPESRVLSPISHWLIVVGITPFLIVLSFLSFRFIEHPAMQNTTVVTAWLRSRAKFLSRDAASGVPLR